MRLAVDPTIGGTLTYTDTQGLPTLIQVPAGAVTEPTTLFYTPVETPTPPSGFAFAGHAFDLDAYQGGALQPGLTFSVPVTVTLHYTGTDVAGLDENALVLEYWNGSAWVDAACGDYDRHPDENWLSAPICHLSRFALFEKGIYGDAAIVCEGPHDGMVIAAKGLSFWEIDIRREGDAVHEVISGGAANPLQAAYRVMEALEANTAQWAQNPDPDVGPQSYFVGQIVGGDYYNRVPTHVHMKGTRRTVPGVDFETMQGEFQDLVNRISDEMELNIDLKLLRSGQSYRLAADEPIVRAVRESYEQILHKSMPLMGLRYTGNASQFNNIAGIPTVYYGADQHRAHANPEWIDIDNLVNAAKIYLLSALNYFEISASELEREVDV